MIYYNLCIICCAKIPQGESTCLYCTANDPIKDLLEEYHPQVVSDAQYEGWDIEEI